MNSIIKTISAFTIVIVVSCGGGSDCGSGFDYTSFDIDNMTLYAHDRNTVYTAPFDDDIYSFDDIEFTIIADEITKLSYIPKTFFQYGLVPRAYACSPVPPSTDEVIREIIITSDSDYSDEYLAGSNLADLFEVISAHGSFLFLPIPLTHYISEGSNSDIRLDLRLIEAPDLSKSHSFTVNYVHMNGEEFVLNSQRIMFE
jgi:hypothetical protein